MLIFANLIYVGLFAFLVDATNVNDSTRRSRIRRSVDPPYRLSRDDNSILHERCGELPRWRGITNKAIGGVLTTTREAPWSVSLQYFDETGEHFYCSGTLISDKHVLTAAHCLLSYEVIDEGNGMAGVVETVRQPGLFKFSFDNECGINYINTCFMDPMFIRYGLRAYVPKGYRAPRADVSTHDIAIFELDRKIEYDKRNYVIPACLHPLFINDGDVFWMFGYGGSTYDQHDPQDGPLRSSTTTAVECTQYMNLQDLTPGADNFCTRGTQHPCKGDSGAGLVRNVSTSFAVVGVHSSSMTPCYARKETNDYVDINVSVYSHGDWICEYTGICMERLGINRPDAYKGGVDIIEDHNLRDTIKYCGDENWILEEVFGKMYCYKALLFQTRTNVIGAQELCQTQNAVISPVRSALELGAVELAMDLAQIHRQPDHRVLVGGEVDGSGVHFKWMFDGSPVTSEATTWLPGRGPGSIFTPGSRCVTLTWYDPHNAGGPPSKIGYLDISCDSKDAVAAVCMKDVDRLEAPKLCGDDNWVVSQIRTDQRLCYRLIHFQSPKNANDAIKECSNIGATGLAPMRNKAEHAALSEAYHRLYPHRGPIGDRSFIIGGHMVKDGWNFVWSIDNSHVSNSSSAWMPDKPSYGSNHSERCMRAIWYAAEPGSIPTELRFSDEDCSDYYDATGVACIKPMNV